MTEPRRYGVRSLRFKLALASVVVEAVMLSLLVWNSTRITGSALNDLYQHKVETLVPLMNAGLADPLAQRDYATLEERLKRIVRQDSLVYIEVRDELGKIAAARGDLPATPHPDTSLDAAAGVFDQEFDITLAGRTIGRARYGLNVGLLEATTASLRGQGAVLALTEIATTFLLLATLGYLLTRHLRMLAQAARAFEGGDHGVQVAVVGQDEVADTARAFNSMARTIARDVTELKRTETALREREQQLSTITDNLPGLVSRVDRNLRYLFVNAPYEQWFGLPPAAIVGRRVPEIIGAEAFARFEPYVRRALAGERVSFESWIKIASGEKVYGRATYVPDVGPEGEIRGHFTLVTDISESRHAEQALREGEEQLRLALDAAHMGTFDWDVPNNHITWSRWHEELWGFKLGDFGGTYEAFSERVHPEDLPGINAEIARCIAAREPFVREFRVVWPNGSIHWIAGRGEFTLGADGKPLRMRGVVVEITERKRVEERLSFLAHHDDLTGLPNRVLFHDRLQRAMIDAERHERLVAVVFVDLDRFKNVNDTLGHEAGDQLLKGVTERLLGAVRRGDTVARLSGDEFTIVLADMAHADDAARVAQKILDVFMQPFHIAGRNLFMGASLGITVFPFDTRDAGELLRNADIAMYRAKESGRNTYQFYAAEMTTKATEAMALENDLRHGLEHGEFLLHYQPIVDGGGHILGAEALLRWQHGRRGLVPPEQFIPLAEETGLILPIGDWVLRQACAQARAWRGPDGASFHMSVNVSPRQFRHRGLARTVETILQETGLDPHALNIEITESVLMQRETLTQELFSQLSGRGVSFSIDDFGTGYSSLSYLKRFAINHLKIDQSFIRDVTTDPDDAALVQAIISMAHSLGIQTIAEGVETWEQRAFLLEHGCDAMQGYYFSRPVPPEAFAVLLAAGKPLPGSGPGSA